MKQMTKLFLGLWCLLAAAVINCPAQQQSKVRISAIQAKLFYENTGAFSENVLTEKGFDLWNTPFDSTYSIFVIVELENVPKEPPDKPWQLELTARYIPVDAAFITSRKAPPPRQIIVRQTEKIRNGSESGKSYAGFWIKNTGCEPVYLAARLAGQKRRARETIKFGCGE
jgi:hypothetical protein